MNFDQIFRHVDHTALAACSTWKEISRLCDEAVEHRTASVCIPPAFVADVKKAYDGKLNICTVIGFPLGYNTTRTKLYEAREAISSGADEIDMVVNLGWVKAENYEAVTDEIRQLKEAVGSKVLKVIVEACYLTEQEKINLCRCVTEAGADFIKTSTGFGTSGAKIEDIELFKKHIGSNVKMKAAGGIRSYEDYVRFLELGCERLGTSSAMDVFGNLRTCTELSTEK